MYMCIYASSFGGCNIDHQTAKFNSPPNFPAIRYKIGDVSRLLPAAIVSVDVESPEVGEETASVDVAPSHRHAQVTPIRINWKLKYSSSSCNQTYMSMGTCVQVCGVRGESVTWPLG